MTCRPSYNAIGSAVGTAEAPDGAGLSDQVPQACHACDRVLKYAKYVDSLKLAEEEPGCEQCTDNRLLLEHAWQVVSTEFFDAHGQFSQAKWADALMHTLQVKPALL